MKRPVAAILIAVVAAVFIALLAPRVMQVRELSERRDGLQNELIVLKRKNAELEGELRLLRDDPVYLEKIARRKFNKAKEGEIVYRVVRPGDSQQPS